LSVNSLPVPCDDMKDCDIIIKAALSGDKLSISRLISLIERDSECASQILEQIYPLSGNAFYLGITGPPGAGKSTLVNKLVESFCQHNLSVAVIAVDPSSPFTGGALLGDRVRLNHKKKDGDCFFRSMSAGRVVGGLAQRTKEASWVFDACGWDVVIIETVGVGQSEVDIMMAADTILVAITPESGDGIQVMKAGVLEIADIFVVNKADRPGAEEIELTLEKMLDGKQHLSSATAWRPPIVRTSANKGEGIKDLYKGIVEHKNYLNDSGTLQRRRELQYKAELIRGIHQEVEAVLKNNDIDDTFFHDVSTLMKSKNILPHSAARMMAKRLFANGAQIAENTGTLFDDLRSMTTSEIRKDSSSQRKTTVDLS